MKPKGVVLPGVGAAVIAIWMSAFSPALVLAQGAEVLEADEQVDAEYVVEAGLQIVVARVASVSDSGATIGNPPRVQLVVERVLRGQLKRGPLDAVWVASLDQPFRCGNESVSERESWRLYYQSPLKGPMVGQRLILGGCPLREEGGWGVSEYVRLPYSSKRVDDLVRRVRRVDAIREAALVAAANEDSRQRAEDRRVLARADVAALCASANEVVLAKIRQRDRILVLERLKSEPQDPVSRAIDERLHLREALSIQERLVITPRDRRMYHRRYALTSPDARDRYDVPSPTYLMFLRRGPYNSERRHYLPADHDNALIVANPGITRAVRAELERQDRSGRSNVRRPPECGARPATFFDARPEVRGGFQLKITSLKRGSYPERTQALLLGHGITEDRHHAFTPCLLPVEHYWHDFVGGAYPVAIDSVAMAFVIGQLGDVPQVHSSVTEEHAIAVAAFVGTIDGVDRVAEVLLDVAGLEAVSASLGRSLFGDHRASWFLNYWRYQFGQPLAADPGFELGGPK